MTPAIDIGSAERMPANMGVIWSDAHGCCLIYIMVPLSFRSDDPTNGERVKSVQVHGGAFLELTPDLIARVEADRRKLAEGA